MPKTSEFSLVMWNGFSDELQKIAAVGLVKPKMTSKPVVKEPDPPSSTLDHLSSSRTMTPPPVTMPGAH